MAVTRRLSPAKRKPNGNGTARSDSPPLLKGNELPAGVLPSKLLNSDEVPSWYTHNCYQHIRTGYRPVNASAALCFKSLGHLHNETVNIYSHLIPAVIALVGNYLLHIYFVAKFPDASWSDHLVFHIYLTGSVICFGVSSLYHTLICHSAYVADLWVRLDYAAIIIQILGSFISGIYVSFYCEPELQWLYWSMIGILGLLTAFVVINPHLQSKEWRLLRLLTFVATGFSAFAPIIHATSIFPYEQLDKQTGLKHYYIEGLAILLGVMFYATHFPESWVPKRFDIWGASHQMFHCLVVVGAIVHFHGILTAFKFNYENQRCTDIAA